MISEGVSLVMVTVMDEDNDDRLELDHTEEAAPVLMPRPR